MAHKLTKSLYDVLAGLKTRRAKLKRPAALEEAVYGLLELVPSLEQYSPERKESAETNIWKLMVQRWAILEDFIAIPVLWG
jgi:hypothetical protein